MLNSKTKALVCSPLLFICVQSHGGQLHPNSCVGAPVYTAESLRARYFADYALNGKPACQRIPHYLDQIIFIGTVTKDDRAEGRAVLYGECSFTSLQTATITVKEVFSGSPPKTLTIHAGDVDGFYFAKGDSYLIVASRQPDGSLVANPAATRYLSEVKDDLAYLRSLSQKPASVDIFGTVWGVTPNPHGMEVPYAKPESLPVSVTKAGFIEIKTNSTGQYKLTGLPAGRYTIRLNTDVPTESDRVQTVDIPPRGCAEINFHIVKPFPPTKPEKKR